MGLGLAYHGVCDKKIVSKLKGLRNDPSDNVRFGAALSMGLIFRRSGNNFVLRTLEKILEIEDKYLRLGAVLALGLAFQGTGNTKILDVLDNVGEVEDEDVLFGIDISVGLVLQNGKRESIEILNEFAKRHNREDSWSFQVSQALVLQSMDRGETINELADIIEMIKSDRRRPEVRSVGFRWLAFVFRESCIEEILREFAFLADDENFYVRGEFALGLGAIYRGSEKEEVLRLLEKLAKDVEQYVAGSALLSIGLVCEGKKNRKWLSFLSGYLDYFVEVEPLISPLEFLAEDIANELELLTDIFYNRDITWNIRGNAALGLGLMFSQSQDWAVANTIIEKIRNDESSFARGCAILGVSEIFKASYNKEILKEISTKLKEESPFEKWCKAVAIGKVFQKKPQKVTLIGLIPYVAHNYLFIDRLILFI